MISLELRQAARDLHRLQSRYEPITTSDANTDGPSAEQTRLEFSIERMPLINFCCCCCSL